LAPENRGEAAGFREVHRFLVPEVAEAGAINHKQIHVVPAGAKAIPSLPGKLGWTALVFIPALRR